LSKGLLFESEEEFKTKFEILKESIAEKKSSIDQQAILEDSVLIEEPKETVKASSDSFVDAIASSMGRYAKQR
jgi:molybdopterin/thiamine biosynthesis adenylyltransferase